MLGGTRIGSLQGQPRPICNQNNASFLPRHPVTRTWQHTAYIRKQACRAAAEPSTAGTSIVEPAQPEQQDAAAAVEHKAQQAAAAPTTAAGIQQDITIAISPAAEQEIQRALLAENGERAAS
jgi:hypothetical protein